MSTFTASANILLNAIAHIKSMHAIDHLTVVRMHQNGAKCVMKRPSYERQKLPVCTPLGCQMRKVDTCATAPQSAVIARPGFDSLSNAKLVSASKVSNPI
jgi:hypothetical protein